MESLIGEDNSRRAYSMISLDNSRYSSGKSASSSWNWDKIVWFSKRYTLSIASEEMSSPTFFLKAIPRPITIISFWLWSVVITTLLFNTLLIFMSYPHLLYHCGYGSLLVFIAEPTVNTEKTSWKQRKYRSFIRFSLLKINNHYPLEPVLLSLS